MHESGVVRRALERELVANARRGAPSSIEVIVRDSSNLLPEVVRLHAADALATYGMAGTLITLRIESQECAGCPWVGIAAFRESRCPLCTLPLPLVRGATVIARARYGGHAKHTFGRQGASAASAAVATG